MFESSRIEISAAALEQNIGFMKSLLGKKTLLGSVVKANAYGHGIDVFPRLAEDMGVRHFLVSSANEAYMLEKRVSDKSMIVVMGDIPSMDALEWLVEKGITFFTYDLARLEKAVSVSRKLGNRARLFVELETGLNRTGFTMTALESVSEKLLSNMDSLEITGICTHFAGAERPENHERIISQIRLFNQMDAFLKGRYIKTGMHSTACSAASLLYPQSRMDLARLGVALYGFWPSQEVKEQYCNMNSIPIESAEKLFEPVLQWKSRIMLFKSIKAGEYIGYSSAYKAEKDKKIALVPVGYAHGLTRLLSNKGAVIVRGEFARIVGYINMNTMAVDVTDIPGTECDDEVVLIGSQKNRSIGINSFNVENEFLNYELLSRLPQDIPRIVV